MAKRLRRRRFGYEVQYYDVCCQLPARHESPHVALPFAASATHRYVGQPTPDKNVNLPCTSSAFTFPPDRKRLRVEWHTRLGGPALIRGFCT